MTALLAIVAIAAVLFLARSKKSKPAPIALAPEGAAEPTHYISTGMIEDLFLSCVTDAGALYAACQAAGADVTQAQCDALVAQSDVSDEPPLAAMARLGLVTWRGEV